MAPEVVAAGPAALLMIAVTAAMTAIATLRVMGVSVTLQVVMIVMIVLAKMRVKEATTVTIVTTPMAAVIARVALIVRLSDENAPGNKGLWPRRLVVHLQEDFEKSHKEDLPIVLLML